MSKRECLAMLLAGGQGSRLGALTSKVAKPAVSFGGKFRIIDFALSNCANSGISTVGVLTQYRPYLLHSYGGIQVVLGTLMSAVVEFLFFLHLLLSLVVRGMREPQMPSPEYWLH